MRAFILICVISAALAAPQGYNYQQNAGSGLGLGLTRTLTTGSGVSSFTLQDSAQPGSGYNYQENNAGLTRTSSFNSDTGSTSSSITNAAPSFLQEALRSTQLMQTLLTNQHGGHQQHGGAVHIPQTVYQPPLRTPQQTLSTFSSAQGEINAANQVGAGALITKDIYVHVAPEDPSENLPVGPALPPPPPRKHYRIVFIKAPAPNLNSAAALRIKQAPVEEKTIIYVLTKKTDPLDLQQAIQEIAPKQPSKPEVYFIKYKTQEEAQHAQRTIQAQYDQLGGTTQVSDEGYAPVTSVIGALDQEQRGGATAQQTGTTLTTTNINTSSSANALITSNVGTGNTNQYLPPIKRL